MATDANQSLYRGLLTGDVAAALDKLRQSLCQSSDCQVVTDRSTLPTEVQQKAEAVKFTENIAVVETEEAAYVILSAGERPTSGYDFAFHYACALDGLLLINAEVEPPAPGEIVLQVITYPQLILKCETQSDAYFWINQAELTVE